MLVLALMLAQLLNNPKIKGKGIFRTLIFLPCATSLVSYSMIFKSLFAPDGVVNRADGHRTVFCGLVPEYMAGALGHRDRTDLEMDRI